MGLKGTYESEVVLADSCPTITIIQYFSRCMAENNNYKLWSRMYRFLWQYPFR